MPKPGRREKARAKCCTSNLKLGWRSPVSPIFDHDDDSKTPLCSWRVVVSVHDESWRARVLPGDGPLFSRRKDMRTDQRVEDRGNSNVKSGAG